MMMRQPLSRLNVNPHPLQTPQQARKPLHVSNTVLSGTRYSRNLVISVLEGDN